MCCLCEYVCEVLGRKLCFVCVLFVLLSGSRSLSMLLFGYKVGVCKVCVKRLSCDEEGEKDVVGCGVGVRGDISYGELPAAVSFCVFVVDVWIFIVQFAECGGLICAIISFCTCC